MDLPAEDSIRRCRQCCQLTENELCNVCSDVRRDPTVICVVELARDVMTLERVGTFRGLYHVLQGRLAPLDEIGPDDPDRRRIIRLQSGELLIQRPLRLVRPRLRKIEQADGQVGEPVFQVAESLLGGACGTQDLDIVGFGRQRLGIPIETPFSDAFGRCIGIQSGKADSRKEATPRTRWCRAGG